jgi:hypothetical protein
MAGALPGNETAPRTFRFVTFGNKVVRDSASFSASASLLLVELSSIMLISPFTKEKSTQI